MYGSSSGYTFFPTLQPFIKISLEIIIYIPYNLLIYLKYTITLSLVCLQRCASNNTVNFRTFSSPPKETSLSQWGHSFSSVQFSRSVVSDSVTPWIAAHQASLSITNFRSLLKLMSIESVMPSNHLILCHPLSSRLQSFPAWGFFQMSQFFTSGDQSIGVSASASVLPMNTLPNPQHQSYATGNLLSVSVDLPILDILHKWNRTICGLLWWASYT